MEIKNSIKGISIKKLTKIFEYSKYHGDEGKTLKNKKDCEERINEFSKNYLVISTEYKGGYCNQTIITYYSGSVEFSPVKQDDSSIKIDVNLKEDAINSIIAMCLDSVCKLCEKQTKVFQSHFVNFVEENQESIVKQQETIKKGLIARGFDKVLNLKDK